MSKFGERGRLGQKRNGYMGIFYEEFLPELRGIRGVETFNEMAENNSTIGAILFAIENLMRQCDFSIEPGGNSAKDKEAAEFIEQCMNDMQLTWAETLSEILSFITYGWSYHEIVYKRRMGKTNNPETNSKYDDGLIGWRKLPIRGQETLYEWIYKDEYSDDLLGMRQQVYPSFEKVDIPLDKALHFRTRSRKDNPEGRSVLRNAYVAWYYQKRIREIEGMGIERDLAGLPILYGPEDMDIWDTEDEDMKRALASAETIVTSIRRDTKEGLVLPNGWKLELLTSGSRRTFDTSAIIQRYDKEMATTVLGDFILLGHEGVGSFALADNKTKMFSLAVGSYLDIICEVFNNQAIPRLIDINGDHFKDITDYPKMKHGDIEDANLDKIGTFISTMAGCGVLTPDDDLEDHIRQVGNLPERKLDLSYQERKGENEQNKSAEEGKKPDSIKAEKEAEQKAENGDMQQAEEAKKSLGRYLFKMFGKDEQQEKGEE